jgi:hypothetical protein
VKELENMVSNLLSFLNQPYPFYYKGKQLFSFALLIFVLSVLFNYFFEPFNNNPMEHRMDFFWISVVHSANATMVVLLFLGPIGLLTNEDNWTVRKEILVVSGLFVLIGIFQFLIRDLIYDNPYNWSWRYLIEEIRNTCLVGILFFSIIVPMNFIRLRSQHGQVAAHFNAKPHSEADVDLPTKIAIQTQQKSDDFLLDTKEFLFARADGNYLEIFVRQDGENQKLLKRMTLKEFETQLKSPEHIIRTHRSYLVNLHQVDSISGNAQGYQLNLKHCPQSIPVSRGMIPSFESRIKA